MLTPNPNECNSTLTSGTINIYPYPYIDINDRGHRFRSGSPLTNYPHASSSSSDLVSTVIISPPLQLSCQKGQPWYRCFTHKHAELPASSFSIFISRKNNHKIKIAGTGQLAVGIRPVGCKYTFYHFQK